MPCRWSGRCAPYLPNRTCANSCGPARPRAMGCHVTPKLRQTEDGIIPVSLNSAVAPNETQRETRPACLQRAAIRFASGSQMILHDCKDI